jgi:hypothetical protein
MVNRKILIGNLDVGDIFHAEYSNGASCVCRVLSINDATIHTKRMTTQEILEFDRQTGIEKAGDGEPLAVINSVAPLPPEVRNVFLGIERKYSQIKAEDWDNPDLERFKLTEAEKKALQFVGPHYASNPLPPPVTI